MKLLRGLACIAIFASAQALAASNGHVPLQKNICVNDIVDKNRLATFLFDANAVSRPFEDAQAALHPPGGGLSSRARIIADTRLCGPSDPCTNADRDAFDGMVLDLQNILTEQGRAYANAKGVTSASQYLTDRSARLVCQTKNGAPVEAVGAPSAASAKAWAPPFRIRATGDDVAVGAGDTSFKGLGKATVSLGGNTSNTTEKIAGAIAYPFEFNGPNNSTYSFVPYAGLNWSSVTTASHGTVVNPQTCDFGVSMDLRSRSANVVSDAPNPFMTNWFAVRPDLLFNGSDGSKLFSLNAKYTPVINSVVNSYINVIPGFISVSALLDARFDNGWYVDRGTSPGNIDYSRLGGRVGIALTSEDNDLPLDLTVSETYLKTLSGSAADVNYFSAVLSLGLDSMRRLGVDLSYNKGTTESTGQAADSWSIALGAKY